MNSFILTTPFGVEVKGNDVFLDGDISTIDQDLVNDVVTPNCLKSMLDQIQNRNIKLDLEHQSFKGSNQEETEIAKTIIPIGRLIDGTQDGKRLRVKGVLNKHHSRFPEAKGSVLDGHLDAFSIAYLPTKVWTEQKNGQTVRMLDDLVLLNVALTGNPVNTSAQIRDIVMKSIDSLKGLDNPGQYTKPKKKVSDDSAGSGVLDDEEKRKKTLPNTTEEQEDEEDTEENKRKKKTSKKGDPIEDYKADPDNVNKLEVKNANEIIFNGITYISSHSGNKNQKEVNNMTEKETKDSETDTDAADTEADATANGADADNGEADNGDTGDTGDADAGDSADDSVAEIKSQEVKSLKAEVAKLTETVDALLKSKDEANSKALANKKAIEESPSIEPVSLIG